MALQIFDKDGDGYITPHELRAVMTQMGEHVRNDEIDAIIREADTDGDGRINYAEFFTMVNKKTNSSYAVNALAAAMESPSFTKDR